MMSASTGVFLCPSRPLCAPPQAPAAASLLPSSLLLHPRSGPGSSTREDAGAHEHPLRPAAVVMVGWRLETCIQGRPITWQLQQDIFSVCLFGVDLEEGPRALGAGRGGPAGAGLAPLAFPIGLCTPLSKAKALLYSQPPPSCHQSRLDHGGGGGSPVPRDLANEFSYSHLLTFPPAASPTFLQL